MIGLAEEIQADELLDVAAQLRDRRVRQQAKRAQVLVAPGDDLLARMPPEHAAHMRRTEPLADARHARQHLAREDDRLPRRLELTEAVVTRAAAGPRIAIAKVLRQVTMAAADARGVAFHPTEQIAARVVQLAVLLEHHPPPHEVRGRVDEQTLGLEAVSPGAPGLLLVVLERPRRPRVDDEPDVGPVDPHPERHGGDHDVCALAEERVLVAGALRVREAGVIRKRVDTDLLQPCRQRVDFLPRRAVDDPGLPAMTFEHVEQLALERRPGQRPVHEIRPIEPANELRRVFESELDRDVAPDARGGRGRVGVQADAWQETLQSSELSVLRPEVVAPLADAVRFVHRDEADARRREERQEAVAAFAHQPLGRDIEQSVPPFPQPGRHG